MMREDWITLGWLVFSISFILLTWPLLYPLETILENPLVFIVILGLLTEYAQKRHNPKTSWEVNK